MKNIYKSISTFGLSAELTKSQNKNFTIIQNHWKKFNEELKKHKLNQGSKNWEKYGVTYKAGENYFYLAAIPRTDKNYPHHFSEKIIPLGEYKTFTHTGKMENIKETIRNIYKTILPYSELIIEPHTKTGFLHFEKYDSRFKWNQPNSIIEIYLPLNTQFK
jgi:predicted transcriptional regulator YdeE